jgi:glycosyltransferase involved in cell wall biosynthesis
MGTSRTIGVCIPTRNQAEFIEDALASAFCQTIAPCEVVVSDDAGTDDTEGVVESFRQRLALPLRARLRYERNSAVLGIGGNFDRAVRLTDGDFVIKLDSDDLLERRFAEVLSRHLERSPAAGWGHCNVLNIRPDGESIGLAHTRKRSGYYDPMTALPAYLRHNDTCHCVMLRKAAYLKVGGYRPEMKTCEDWLLWLEMLLGGWGYCFDELPLARMRKYKARRELMSNRRTNFIASARIMVSRIESVCRKNSAALGMAPDAALSRFRAATARLCVSSGCDEGESSVRRDLFKAAYEFDPSVRTRLWLAFGPRVPAGLTRLGTILAGVPRSFARPVAQALHLRKAP